jgi:hypothetical protein
MTMARKTIPVPKKQPEMVPTRKTQVPTRMPKAIPTKKTSKNPMTKILNLTTMTTKIQMMTTKNSTNPRSTRRILSAP